MRRLPVFVVACVLLGAGCGDEPRDREDADGCAAGPRRAGGTTVFRHCGPASANARFDGPHGVTVRGFSGGRCTFANETYALDLGETIVDQGERSTTLDAVRLSITVGTPGGLDGGGVRRLASAGEPVVVTWFEGGRPGRLEPDTADVRLSTSLRSGRVEGTAEGGTKVEITWNCNERVLPRRP